MISLTKSVALHCGETGLPIRCNAICPGVIDTPLLRHSVESADEPRALQDLANRQILRRLGAPKEVADAAVFLASDEASFITGAVLSVDGGFAIRDL